jgi:ABC-type multidrug transport system fused ATPase/permease subunit
MALDQLRDGSGVPAVDLGAAVIEVRDLRMRYGQSEVLSGVDFTVRPGEVLTLLGPNGAGKTTIIEILEGFRIRSAGEVRVLGADPASADEAWRARIGIVLQSGATTAAGGCATCCGISAGTTSRSAPAGGRGRGTSTSWSRRSV